MWEKRCVNGRVTDFEDPQKSQCDNPRRSEGQRGLSSKTAVLEEFSRKNKNYWQNLYSTYYMPTTLLLLYSH